MPQIEGTLKRARKTKGWLSDLVINVEGQVFYKRLWETDNRRAIRGYIGETMLHVGETVRVTYERRKLISTDIVIEKFFLGNISVPQEYNEIISLEYVKNARKDF